MGKVIQLQPRLNQVADNLITSEPWEFRTSHWETAYFIRMSKLHSGKLEYEFECDSGKGHKDVRHLKSHLILKGSMAYTILAMFSYRENEEKMLEVYYLTGLMDCMINQVNPILRTHIFRSMYKKVFAMKDTLDIHWYGPLDQVLLPIDSWFYNASEYRSSLNRARTMKELYHAIRKGTTEMFDIISREYVFYCSGKERGQNHFHR